LKEELADIFRMPDPSSPPRPGRLDPLCLEVPARTIRPPGPHDPPLPGLDRGHHRMGLHQRHRRS